MNYQAVAKSVGTSPRKVKLVVDLVRGKDLTLAFGILANLESPVRIAVQKVIKSAASNAEQKGAKVDKLYVKEIYATQAATLKRMRPRAKGSGNRILKRSSHITAVVAERE